MGHDLIFAELYWHRKKTDVSSKIGEHKKLKYMYFIVLHVSFQGTRLRDAKIP
jgi:hypothetical protein